MDTGENSSSTPPSFHLSVPERSVDTRINPRFGFLRSERTAVPDGASSVEEVPVTVQQIPAGTWSDAHLARLRTTAPLASRNTDGIVPVARVSGEPGADVEVVSLRTDAPRFQERLDFRTPPAWNESAGVTLAAAEAMEKAHSLGLRHGALQPEDVVVDGNELAIAGMGLSLGGTPEAGIAMAPEVASSGVPTVPGDVYSLGKLLETGTAGDPTTPAAVQSVIADATATNPNERIPSAREFANRLRTAGGDAIRTYTPMSFADSPLFRTGTSGSTAAAGLAAAGAGAAAVTGAGAAAGTSTAATSASTAAGATTVGGPTAQSTGRRALPWIAAAALAGLVGVGLWAASGDDGGDQSSTDSAVATTSEPTTSTTDTSIATTSSSEPTSTATTGSTSTTDPSTSTTGPTTTGSTTTTTPTTTTAPTTTTELPTTAPPTSQIVPGATPVQDAGLEILHGIPNTPVDAYLDGELVLTNFNSGEIAGPLALPEGLYDIDLFAAETDPAAASADRSDAALASTTLGVTGQPATVVVVPTADGNVQFQAFTEDLNEVAAGEGRLTIRNPGPGPATVRIEGNTGSEPVEAELAAGAAVAANLAAGDYTVTLTGEDGEIIVSGLVSNAEGSLTTATVISSDSGEPQLLLQRIGALGSPPDGIPTGDSGLLPGPNDGRAAGLLLAGLGAAGLLGVVGNQRLRRKS